MTEPHFTLAQLAEMTMLTEVFALRRMRETCSPEDARQGFLAETIEGTAEWVGLSALAQLSPEKAAKRPRQIAARLTDAGPHQPDTRRVSYDSGVCLLTLACRASRPLPTGREESISAQLAAQATSVSPALPAPEETAYRTSVLARQRAQRQRTLATFRTRPLRRMPVPFCLCGMIP